MRYYLMAVLGSVFGHLFFDIYFLWDSVAISGSSKNIEVVYAHPEIFFLTLLPVWVFGILPSIFGLWLYISITKDIDRFVFRLIISPFAGFIAISVYLIPYYLLGISWYMKDLLLSTLEAAPFAAFMTALIFDNPIIRRRIPN